MINQLFFQGCEVIVTLLEIVKTVGCGCFLYSGGSAAGIGGARGGSTGSTLGIPGGTLGIQSFDVCETLYLAGMPAFQDGVCIFKTWFLCSRNV